MSKMHHRTLVLLTIRTHHFTNSGINFRKFSRRICHMRPYDKAIPRKAWQQTAISSSLYICRLDWCMSIISLNKWLIHSMFRSVHLMYEINVIFTRDIEAICFNIIMNFLTLTLHINYIYTLHINVNTTMTPK